MEINFTDNVIKTAKSGDLSKAKMTNALVKKVYIYEDMSKHKIVKKYVKNGAEVVKVQKKSPNAKNTLSKQD